MSWAGGDVLATYIAEAIFLNRLGLLKLITRWEQNEHSAPQNICFF